MCALAFCSGSKLEQATELMMDDSTHSQTFTTGRNNSLQTFQFELDITMCIYLSVLSFNKTSNNSYEIDFRLID